MKTYTGVANRIFPPARQVVFQVEINFGVTSSWAYAV
jgi:hypothetical protein